MRIPECKCRKHWLCVYCANTLAFLARCSISGNKMPTYTDPILSPRARQVAYALVGQKSTKLGKISAEALKKWARSLTG